MTEWRVGVVGYGWASSAHIAAVDACETARVTAVCSSRELNETELSARHGTPIRCFRALADMLPHVDVVSICSYPSVHAEHATAAALAGKHLIIEKPLALSLEDCRRTAAAIAQAGVTACVCFECRYSGQFQATRSIVEQGLLGRVHYGEIDYYHGIGPWYGQGVPRRVTAGKLPPILSAIDRAASHAHLCSRRVDSPRNPRRCRNPRRMRYTRSVCRSCGMWAKPPSLLPNQLV